MLSTSFCESCRVSLSGPAPASQHYAGKKHAKTMRRVRGAVQLVQTCGVRKAPYASVSAIMLKSSSGASQELCTYQGIEEACRVNQEESDDDEDGHHNNEYKWNGESGWCYLCKVWFTSSIVAHQHLDGHRHNKALQLYGTLKSPQKQLSLTSGSCVQPCSSQFICEVCFKRVDTADQLWLHRQSPAHLKMAASTPWSSLISRGGVPGDNTDWETCPVCEKQVNSKDQLLVHMRSHGGHQSVEYASTSSPKAVDWTRNSGNTLTTSKKIQPVQAASSSRSGPSPEASDSDSSAESPPNKRLKLGGSINCRSSEGEKSWTLDLVDRPFGPQYRYYCPLCMVPFDTLQTKLEHERGKQHAAKAVRRTTALARILPDIKNSTRVCSDGDDGFSLTKTTPRPYQVELYEAATKNDSICFLPTGTGKTLVSVMIISRMLQLNPHHSAVFLVDKVLLALQQSKVIRNELSEKTFERWNRSTNSISPRRLRIAMLCGQKEDLKGVELWEHDVIVVTAAYYSNLLDKGAVRWTDNCVAVFDEVHHCHDEHPYRKLMQQTEHATLVTGRRPKLLGLTASPAGKDTVQLTEAALRKLLRDFGAGETKLVRVWRNKDDLAKYQSSAELKIVEVGYSAEELKLLSQLERGVTTGCQRLLERSERVTIDGYEEEDNVDETRAGIELLMKNLAGMASSEASLASGNSRRSSESHLDVQSVEILTESVRHVKDKHTNTTSADVEIIGRYLRVVGQSLVSLSAEGIDGALRDLDDEDELDGDENNGDDRQRRFDTVCRQLELPGLGIIRQELSRVRSTNCTHELRRTVIRRYDGIGGYKDGDDSTLQRSSMFRHLVEELVLWWDSSTSRDRIALVLVRDRGTARTWSSQLDHSDQLRSRRMRVVHLVGHGGGKRKSDDQHVANSGCEGMTVSRQSRVIKEIWKGKYSVIVATSVAEEGIDLPECDLVVRLDAPDCVRALVQVRGRARRRGGKFVVFNRGNCGARLEQLLKQERNMEQAVDLIVERHK